MSCSAAILATCSGSISVGSGSSDDGSGEPRAATNRSNCPGVVIWKTLACSERIWNVWA